MDDKLYDGHTALFGMDADTNPSELPPVYVSRSVNRVFRGGQNRTRPVFREVELVFDNTDDSELFANGNVQGATEYLKTRVGRRDGLVVSIAGTILFIALVNEKGYVHRVFTGNSKARLHAFFCQAEEWLYIQDGKNLPVFWDGLTASEARRSSGAVHSEMPIGTIMAYAHGRVFITNEYNQMVASDVMFGNGFTNTTNVQKFTENTYWLEGGYFQIPSNLGEITGAIVMPAFSQNSRGQGELIIFTRDGAVSFDVGKSRLLWKDEQIQRTALTGRGSICPNSVISVNGDVWYRSADGWASYTNTRIDINQKTAYRKFSREVNYWLDQDTPHLIRYGSHIFHDNRILGTVSPQLSLTRDTTRYGAHRYFRGLISLDLDGASGLRGGDAINFDGLWTGIRPTQLVTSRSRAYAFSFDSDGKNRLYEITNSFGDDLGKVKIQSQYITRRMAATPSGGNVFHSKRLVGGEIWLSELRREIGASIEYRADGNHQWNELMPETTAIPDSNLIQESLPVTVKRFKRWKLPTPDPDKCAGLGCDLTVNGAEHQFLVKLTGTCRVDRLRLSFKPNVDTDLVGDDVCGGAECEPKEELNFSQGTQNDFEYSIR